MGTVTKTPALRASAARDPEIVPVYVWEWPVRIFHWIMVLSLVVLTVTGFYMHRPFIVATSSRAWVMGTMRFVHEIFGFILISVLLLRIYWFFAGNEWARWRAWIPLTKGQWASIRSMLLYYSYQRSEPEPEIGHNSLATSTYMVIVFLLVLECLTGLVGQPFATVARWCVDRSGVAESCASSPQRRSWPYWRMPQWVATLGIPPPGTAWSESLATLSW